MVNEFYNNIQLNNDTHKIERQQNIYDFIFQKNNFIPKKSRR